MTKIKLDKSKNVTVSIDLVGEMLTEEKQRLQKMINKSIEESNMKLLRESHKIINAVINFEKQLDALRKSWKKIAQMHKNSPQEVKNIVDAKGKLFGSKIVKNHVSGYSRQVESVGPASTFSVEFSDHNVIQENSAINTFVKVINKIGPDKIQALNLINAGEMLIAPQQSKKYPSASRKLNNGLFLNCHCNTKNKIQLLETISQRLNLNLKINKFLKQPKNKKN